MPKLRAIGRHRLRLYQARPHLCQVAAAKWVPEVLVCSPRQGDVLHQVNADFVKPIGQFLGVGAMPVGAEARARAKGDDVEVEGVRGVEDLFADELDLWMEEFHVVCVVFRMSCVGFRVSWGFMGQR